MDKNCCENCGKEPDKDDSLLDSPWEDGSMVCNDCFVEQEGDVLAYLSDMEYACVNGCCACCGCNCYY